jgi:hypothetical protein
VCECVCSCVYDGLLIHFIVCILFMYAYVVMLGMDVCMGEWRRRGWQMRCVNVVVLCVCDVFVCV